MTVPNEHNKQYQADEINRKLLLVRGNQHLTDVEREMVDQIANEHLPAILGDQKEEAATKFRAFQKRTEYANGHAVAVEGVEANHGPFKRTSIDSMGRVHATDELHYQRVFSPENWVIRYE